MAVKENHEVGVPLSLHRDIFQRSVTKMLLCIMNMQESHEKPWLVSTHTYWHIFKVLLVNCKPNI